MADSLTKEQRSWVMGRIRGRNTKPEIMLRSILHHLGYRFTIAAPNNRRLPGRPDIVLPKHNTIIFVHGCFWHRHKDCPRATMPKTRRKYWRGKFESNVARDKRNVRNLRKDGWSVLTIWECQVEGDPLKVAAGLDRHLRGEKRSSYALPSRRELLKTAERKADYAKIATTQWSQ